MSFSNFLESALVSHVVGKTEYSSPSVFLGASTADPTEDGSGWAELSGGGYSRQPIGFNAAEKKDTSPFGAFITSATDVYLGPAPAGGWSFSMLAWWGLFDARSGGNLLAYASSMATSSVAEGQFLRLPAGALRIDLDSGDLTTFACKSLLDRAFAQGSFGLPTVYAALCTGMVDVTQEEASGINELSGSGYARANLTGKWGTATQVSGLAQISTNANADFPTATADWQAVGGGGLTSASSGGKMLLSGVLADSVFNGDIARIASGGAIVSIG